MITLPLSAPIIDQTFEYRPGVLLSPNVSLDSLTRGDYSSKAVIAMQRTSPLFIDFDSVDFDPFKTNRQPLIDAKWKIAANLQYLAYGIIEPLLKEFNPIELQFISAYLDPQRSAPDVTFNQSKHFSGEGLTFTINSAASNIYTKLGHVLHAIKGNFVELGLMFSQWSWFHVGIQGPYTYNQYPGHGTYDEPRIFTRDLTTGESFTGFMPARSF